MPFFRVLAAFWRTLAAGDIDTPPPQQKRVEGRHSRAKAKNKMNTAYFYIHLRLLETVKSAKILDIVQYIQESFLCKVLGCKV